MDADNLENIESSLLVQAEEMPAPTAAEVARAIPASNPFEAVRTEILQPYLKHVSGELVGALCIVTSQDANNISTDMRTSLYSAAQRLGYDTQSVTWFYLGDLEDKPVATVIEALDPLAIIILDAPSIERVAKAYRIALPIDNLGYVLGRPTVCCRNFSVLLKKPETKVFAWKLLKLLGVPKEES